MGNTGGDGNGEKEWLHQVLARFEDHTLEMRRVVAELRAANERADERWEENKRRWGENDRRWGENERRWERHMKDWDRTSRAVVRLWEELERRCPPSEKE